MPELWTFDILQAAVFKNLQLISLLRFYPSRNRTAVIVSMPRKRLVIARCASPWLRERGSSSSKLMKTIIPATNANAMLIMKGLMKGNRTKNPMAAPIGSDIPERNDQRHAFFLFFVA